MNPVLKFLVVTIILGGTLIIYSAVALSSAISKTEPPDSADQIAAIREYNRKKEAKKMKREKKA